MYHQRRYQDSKNSFPDRNGYRFLSQNLKGLALIIAILAVLLIAQSATAAEGTSNKGIIDTIANFFEFINNIIEFIKEVIEWIVAIFKNPLGFLNQCINWVVDLIAGILPSTPEDLKINSLISKAGSSIPLIGEDLISELVSTFGQLASLATIIKIYKLIPFKAT